MSICEDKIRFCTNVKALKEKYGITLKELACRSGVSLITLEALERENIPAKMMADDVFGLARAFGCKAYELFQ